MLSDVCTVYVSAIQLTMKLFKSILFCAAALIIAAEDAEFWRDQTIYQVLTDRFALPREWQETHMLCRHETNCMKLNASHCSWWTSARHLLRPLLLLWGNLHGTCFEGRLYSGIGLFFSLDLSYSSKAGSFVLTCGFLTILFSAQHAKRLSWLLGKVSSDRAGRRLLRCERALWH